MEHKKSLLNSSALPITPQIELYIPTVGEILEDEKYYYNLVFSLCSTPSDYMVQLDDAGIDYTKITDYELFLMLFQIHKAQDFSLLFPKLDMSGFQICSNSETQEKVLYDEMSGIMLDSLITSQITNTLRLINGLKKHVVKPGNEKGKALDASQGLELYKRLYYNHIENSVESIKYNLLDVDFNDSQADKNKTCYFYNPTSNLPNVTGTFTGEWSCRIINSSHAIVELLEYLPLPGRRWVRYWNGEN